MTGVKRYKYQALVTLVAKDDDGPDPALGPAPRRMILRGPDEETHRNRFFTALVSCGGGAPCRPAARNCR